MTKKEIVNNKKVEVQEYIESRGGTLVGDYKNAKTKVRVIGTCGHEFEMKYNDIKKRDKPVILCQKCNSRNSQKPLTSEEWIDKGESIGFSDISIENNIVKVMASCGHIASMSFSGYRKRLRKEESRCRNCITNSKRDFTRLNVKRIIKEGGGRMISITDDLKMVRLKYKCGHEGEVTSDNIKNKMRKYSYLLCPECSSKEHTSPTRESSKERGVTEYIRSLGFEVKQNYRKNYPHGLEIDTFVESKQIGFEMDGIYWHSEEKGKGKNYHIDKTKHFAEQGIRLFHFTDLEWNKKKPIVMSIISARRGVSPLHFQTKKCKIKKIDAAEARKFFDENHIQGGNGATNNTLALTAGGEILAAMSFRRTAGLDESSMELYRYATILRSSIAGGFSRLLSAFKKETSFTRVVTYADLRFSPLDPEATVYGKSGFTLLSMSPPNYKYFKDTRELLDRRKFQKHKLQKILEKFDKNKTEVENMKINGYGRIFDCGNLVFELIL